MNYSVINIWGAFLPRSKSDEHKTKDILVNEYLSTLKTKKYDGVIILAHGEKDYRDFPYHKEIINIARDKDIKVYATIGSSKFYDDPVVAAKNVEIIEWPTFFFRNTLVQMSGRKVLTPIKKLNDLEYQYHFIYLNNKARLHRMLLLDNIAKFDMLKYCAFTWHKKDKKSFFKYYDGSIKTLDKQFMSEKAIENQFNVPKEYDQSFFQVVAETHAHCHFITEKTVIPLLLGKPFLILGAPNIHKVLKDLGFKLYDELFDYSFDNIEDISERIDALCNTIKNITDLPLDRCKQIDIQDKLIFNRNRAIEIALDPQYVPNIIKDIIEHYDQTNDILDNQIIKSELAIREIKKDSTLCSII